MDNFWKLFITLFGIGAAISFAKSLKSKKNWREIVSEMIITGFLAVGAATALIVWPNLNMIVIAGLASLLASLGVAFVSNKLEDLLEKLADYLIQKLTKKE